MKKDSAVKPTDKILGMEIESFGISALSSWARKKAHGGSNRWTVGDLVRLYPCRFTTKTRSGGIRIGLGVGPIAELKKKLIELGLTPDNWPALVEHDQLLVELSKERIAELPVLEVFSRNYGYCNELHKFLGCEEREVSGKRVLDFISVDPNKLVDKTPEAYFFRSKRCQFISLRRALVDKGFSISDGPFFKWNPESELFEKAMRIVQKHKFPTKMNKKSVQEFVAKMLVDMKFVT